VLLDYLAGRAPDVACQVARATGVQSEMELAFAGLHQLSGPMLSRAERLPVPQRDALRIAFGLAEGPPPDRYFVGLALLNLLSEAGRERPLICLVDDQQWLDRASAQALGFAARRLAADPVGLVFAAREPGGDLAGLAELEVGGLPDGDARALLVAALTGPLDAEVRDLIVAETRGNPLALLELLRGPGPAELADGFGLPGAAPLTGRIEDSFARQLAALPDQTRRLVQLAAADPSGDRSLVWRAAGRLGIPAAAGEPAEEAGLVEFGGQIRFRHPLARSAAYRSAALPVRRQLHAALAEATDPIADPDRRAWHLAQAAVGPDEEVAAELERPAGRLRPELAGTQLLYGEWLRRENRRADARDQLRAAHRQLTSIGMGAFAERARRELLATGAAVPEHGAEAREQLTPQEEQIARLARDGLSNPEIGAQLFLSARTVQYHLRKVFTKLGISSRRELPTALARRGQDGLSA
jgi:DNA-binding CsgD family transcriptional regulator